MLEWAFFCTLGGGCSVVMVLLHAEGPKPYVLPSTVHVDGLTPAISTSFPHAEITTPMFSAVLSELQAPSRMR